MRRRSSASLHALACVLRSGSESRVAWGMAELIDIGSQESFWLPWLAVAEMLVRKL